MVGYGLLYVFTCIYIHFITINLTVSFFNGQFLTQEYVSRFSQNWEEIFGNGLWYHVSTEFAYLGILLNFSGSDR